MLLDDAWSLGNKYGERPELEQLLRQHMKQDSDSNGNTTTHHHWYTTHDITVADVTGTRTISKCGIDWPPLATGNLPFKVILCVLMKMYTTQI